MSVRGWAQCRLLNEKCAAAGLNVVYTSNAAGPAQQPPRKSPGGLPLRRGGAAVPNTAPTPVSQSALTCKVLVPPPPSPLPPTPHSTPLPPSQVTCIILSFFFTESPSCQADSPLRSLLEPKCRADTLAAPGHPLHMYPSRQALEKGASQYCTSISEQYVHVTCSCWANGPQVNNEVLGECTNALSKQAARMLAASNALEVRRPQFEE